MVLHDRSGTRREGNSLQLLAIEDPNDGELNGDGRNTPIEEEAPPHAEELLSDHRVIFVFRSRAAGDNHETPRLESLCDVLDHRVRLVSKAALASEGDDDAIRLRLQARLGDVPNVHGVLELLIKKTERAHGLVHDADLHLR